MLLAGPILRQVDVKSVNIWIALDENPIIKAVLKKGDTDVSGDSSDDLTYQIGTKLYVKLISFTPTADLKNEDVYTYDLKNGDVSILSALVDTTDTPLGYEEGKLPSFVLPAKDLIDLKVAHGSCRKMHGDGPEALSLLDDVLAKADNRNTPKNRIQQLFLTGDQIYADEIPRFALWSISEWARKNVNINEDLPLPLIKIDDKEFPAKRIFPADAVSGLRQTLLNDYAKMTTGSGEAHLLTFGEFAAAYLHAWSPDVWAEDLKQMKKSAKDALNATTIDTIWDNYKPKVGFTEANLKDREYLFSSGKREELKKAGSFAAFFQDLEKGQKVAVAKELIEVADFFDSLKKVRRVLANTPTYMMCDDHEITDDWNISMRWKNTVYSNPLGKAIVRNGLMAYTLFQDLGNTPSEYKKADSKKTALATEIKNYIATTNFSTFSTAKIDEILGITDEKAQVQVNWHYVINSGAKVKTLFLDTRNRRGYKFLDSRPALLSPQAFIDEFSLLPANPQADEVLFLITPCPAIGMSVFEELVYPLYTSGESAKKGLLVGQIVRDNEAWSMNSEAYETLLKKLSAYKRVVLFGGDVHYGFSTYLDYWKKGDLQPSRFIQLVSTPIKNLWDKNVRLFHTGFTQGLFEGFGSKIEKFGWDSPPSVSGNQISLVNRRRLREKPAVIDSFGWREGVTVSPEPDWRYRLQIPFDDREDPVPEFQIKDDFDHTKNEDIKRIANRFQRDFNNAYSRRFVFSTHICHVHFENDSLKHTFLYRAADRTTTLETVHQIALTATIDNDKKIPELPKPQPKP